MEYATEKWGGRPHYRGLVHHLGDDEHGCWLWGPAGRTIYRGDEPLFVTEQAALVLVPRGAWWSLAWWVQHTEVDLYVNINTPAAFGRERIVAVDLDLDVVRTVDGRVEVVDRDEFELHQVQYAYPADLIEAAEAATTMAHDLVLANERPFDGVAAESWIEVAAARP